MTTGRKETTGREQPEAEPEAPIRRRGAGRGVGRDGAPRWRQWSAQVALVGTAAALLYLALASWSDPREVSAAMRRLPGGAAATAGMLVAAGLCLRALRWHYYTRALGLRIPGVANLWAFVAGFAFTATPGKAGEIVKSLLLKRRFGARVAQTAGTLLVERVTDLLAVVLVAGAGLGGGAGHEWVLWASALVVSAATVLLASERLQRALLASLERVPALGRAAQRAAPFLDSSRRLLVPRRLGAGLLLAVAAWSCEAVALDVVLAGLGTEISRGVAFFAFGAATLLGVASMLPGGLGGFEAAMVLILAERGVGATSAVAATLLFRLGTLWAVSVVGLAALGAWVARYGAFRSALPAAVVAPAEDETDAREAGASG